MTVDDQEAGHSHKSEALNTVTHLVGAVLATLGSTVLLVLAAVRGDAWRLVSFAIYGGSLILTYLASTLYHALKGRAKRVFRRLDHMSIFLLIAGTYTPFALVTLRNRLGWIILAVVWVLAVTGIALQATLGDRAKSASLVLYPTIGWIGVAVAKPLLDAIDVAGFSLVAAGGLLYTAGFAFLALKSIRRHHEIWHLFVLGGSACHYAAISLYVL